MSTTEITKSLIVRNMPMGGFIVTEHAPSSGMMHLDLLACSDIQEALNFVRDYFKPELPNA